MTGPINCLLLFAFVCAMFAFPDVHYPTPTGCLFSWLVSTTYQDAMAPFWTVSHVMNSTEGTDGKQCHECPLYTKKEKAKILTTYTSPQTSTVKLVKPNPPTFHETTCICLVNMILIGFLWLPIWSPMAGTTSHLAKLPGDHLHLIYRYWLLA